MSETDKIIAAIFTAARMMGREEDNLLVYFNYLDEFVAGIQRREEKAAEGMTGETTILS